jgi:mycofactocin precursor
MTGQTMTAQTTAIAADEPAAEPEPAPVAEPALVPDVTIGELLVEEVSIDGMCGVY